MGAIPFEAIVTMVNTNKMKSLLEISPWRAILSHSLIFIFLAASPSIYGQTGVGANFGIEADTYSGDITSGLNTDDWFYNGSSGAGVIDEATAASMTYGAQLAAGNNIAFDLRQSLPNYFANNGYLWYSSRYGRDYTNQSSSDLTTFTGGKNGDNPTTSWGLSSGALPAKTDIVDVGVHMRRNGTNTSDDLWVDLMISTLSYSGNHFIDFELFVSEIATTATGFTNSGSQEGHTAWEFDASGDVTQVGDMIIGFAYTGGGVSGLEVRLWVDRATFNPGTSPGGTSTFTWGSNIDGGSTYGYGEIIVPPAALLNHVNTVSVAAPPWGTTNTSGYTNSYSNGYLAEVGVNFRQLGFDPELLFGPSAACDSPFSAVLAKSRTSSSFTSTLKDFAGPYDFLGSSANSVVNTAIDNATTIAPFDSCSSNETRTLTSEFNSPNAEYTWYSLTPGVVFPGNGLSQISGIAMYNVTIDSPGEYQLGIAPLSGCAVITNPDNSLTVPAIPCAVDDYFVVVENSTANTVNVLFNDTDLEVDIDQNTLNNSGLLQPSNGTVTINTGVLSYQPDTNFAGIDTFEYQICDSNSPVLCDVAVVTVYVQDDSDNDGVPDSTDLDDDNDGVPDSLELNTIVNNNQPACGGETSLDFSSPAILQSGTALQQGAIYRIANVTTGTDALLTVVQTFNATIADIDDNAEEPASFRPRTAFSLTDIGEIAYIEYKIEFVSSGGTAPVVINKFFVNFNDIDGNNNYGEQIWSDNPSGYTISNPTDLTMTTEGSWVLGTGGTSEYPGAGNTFPQVNYSVNYTSKSEMVLRVGAVARVAGVSAAGRQHNMEFNCLTNFVNPETYGIDNDSDGVANHLDLDSDNDGIYDSVEAGHVQAHLNGVVTANYGANGLADNVETSVESGVINYSIVDTDGSSPPNYLDTDSDNDGCSDANEAYSNADADGGDNEYFGTGDPPPTDLNGRVTAASYSVPADTGGNGTLDYLEDIIAVISTQPQNTNVCPGCNTTFTATATNDNVYQWQQFNGTTWVDLTNSGIHSGTNTNTLVITNATPADNGNQYRVQVYSDNYICGPTISDVVTLTVKVNTVITNRRITYRVKKN